MPLYLLSFDWIKILWPLLSIAGIVSLAVWFGYIKATSNQSAVGAIGDAKAASSTGARPGRAHATVSKTAGGGKALLVIFSFAILGLTIGWLTGDSGEQVLASVLPAVLTLIGGLAVFLVGKQFHDATMIAAAVTALTFNLLVGALLASEHGNLEKELQERDLLQKKIRDATGLQSDADIDTLQKKVDAALQVQGNSSNQ